MANNSLKHRKCGGYLAINVASMFSIKSPSMIVTPRGISVGVTEMQVNPKGTATFVCSKCAENLPMTAPDITLECSVCRKYHPSDDTFYSDSVPTICGTCIAMLTGEKTPTPEIERISSFIRLPRNSVEFTSYSMIFSKKIQL